MFSRTPALDQLVQRWSSYREDVDVACDEILSCRPDIVLDRDRNAIIGALGEAAMGQYIYDGIDSAHISVPSFSLSSRFLIDYESEPLLAVTIADKERGIVREYDGIVGVGDTLAILECKVINSIGNILRTPRGQQRKEKRSQRMRRNETKLAHLARRFTTVKGILSDLTGTSDVAMIYFLPHDTYAGARARHGLLHALEHDHGVYVVPFSHDAAAFFRGAKRIAQHAKHARWIQKYRYTYPSIYKGKERFK